MWTNSYALEQTGEFLRDVQHARGIRQDDLAHQLGVSHTTLSGYERSEVPAISPHDYLALHISGYAG